MKSLDTVAQIEYKAVLRLQSREIDKHLQIGAQCPEKESEEEDCDGSQHRPDCRIGHMNELIKMLGRRNCLKVLF